MSIKKKLVLIDSMGIIHRAFHAYPGLTTSDGQLINAVFGFGTMFLQILKNLKPDYVIFATDVSSKTFRSKTYLEYKAQRKEMDEGLRNQIPLIMDLIESTGFPVFSKEDYEADDIIGSIAHRFYKDYHIQIVTGDKDLLQLIEDGISVVLPGKTFSDMREYHEEQFIERFGFKPSEYIDYKCLVGDNSDNIKGAKGIGEKTATELIKQFHSIEDIYTDINDNDAIKDRYKKLLLASEDVVFANKPIVTIYKELDLDVKPEETSIKNFNLNTFTSFLKKYEFNSLLGQLKKLNLSVNPELITPEDEDKKIIEFKKNKNDSLFENTFDCFLPYKDSFFYFNEKFEYDISDKVPESGIGFNIKPLYKSGILKKDGFDDLQIMSYCLNPEYGDPEILKIYKKIFHHEPSDLYEAKIDADIDQDFLLSAIAFVDIYKKVKTEIGEKELWVYKNIDLPVMPVIAHIENYGLRINTQYLKRLEKIFTKKIDEIKQNIFNTVGHEFNPNSTKELSHVLFEELSLPKVKKIKTGYSTDERTISKLSGVHPIIDMILEYREYTKLQSTYVVGLQKVIQNDRIYTELRQTVVATGRLSSINPNLQNIPTRSETGELIRKAFIADEGFTLVSLDYSQIELRLMAEVSCDENFIQAFKDGKDIHTNTAALMFNIEEKDVTPEQRRIAKMINFGIIYGISDFGLSDRLGGGIDVKTAKAFIAKYFERYPKIKEYFDKTKEFVGEKGYVETMFGRRRYFNLEAGNYMMKQAMYREAINMPIQGADADIVKLAMIKVEKLIEEKYSDKVKMLLQIHDELLFEIINDEKVKEDFLNEAREIMEHVVDLSVPMEVHSKEGENWGDMK